MVPHSGEGARASARWRCMRPRKLGINQKLHLQLETNWLWKIELLNLPPDVWCELCCRSCEPLRLLLAGPSSEQCNKHAYN